MLSGPQKRGGRWGVPAAVGMGVIEVQSLSKPLRGDATFDLECIVRMPICHESVDRPEGSIRPSTEVPSEAWSVLTGAASTDEAKSPGEQLSGLKSPSSLGRFGATGLVLTNSSRRGSFLIHFAWTPRRLDQRLRRNVRNPCVIESLV